MTEAIWTRLSSVHEVVGLGDVLDFRARTQGKRDAVICGGERITYEQLKSRAIAFAHHLEMLGIKAGDKVAIYLPNGPQFIPAFFGTTGLDAVVVPVNPLLRPDEIAHILEDSQASAVIAHQDLLDTALPGINQSQSIRGLLVVAEHGASSFPPLASSVKVMDFDEKKAPRSTVWPRKVRTEHMPAVIMYTSGTTGKPKGAVLSHHNLISSFPTRLHAFDVDENDRLLGMLPMCHIFGLAVNVLGTISRGACLVVLPKFEARAALQAVEAQRVTLIPAVPAMFQMMLFEMQQADFDTSSVRLCFSGAAPLPVKVINAIESRFGAPLIEGYGLTETAAAGCMNLTAGIRKPGSVGLPSSGLALEIMAEDGSKLPPGADNVGEIAMSGSNVMLGYYRQPEATAEVIKDGWFFTGDLGYKDEEGHVFIVGRKKEMIIRGGANVYPREVEEVIMKLPGVRETAVIGIPDEIMGERVKAFVVSGDPKITEDTVKQHCDQHLAHYKVPRIVEFIDALPRNSTGKVLKRLLK